MRIAWVTPLPPTPSGIADYAFELLPLVAESAETDVFATRPGRFRRPSRPSGVRVLDASLLGERFGDYDAVFHHLGNNPHHEFVYRASLALPGVAVFHDFSLHHLIAHLTVEMGADDLPGYEHTLEEDYGPSGVRLARLRWHGVASEFEKFLFPANGHVARNAKALIVHSQDVR